MSVAETQRSGLRSLFPHCPGHGSAGSTRRTIHHVQHERKRYADRATKRQMRTLPAVARCPVSRGCVGGCVGSTPLAGPDCSEEESNAKT